MPPPPADPLFAGPAVPAGPDAIGRDRAVLLAPEATGRRWSTTLLVVTGLAAFATGAVLAALIALVIGASGDDGTDEARATPTTTTDAPATTTTSTAATSTTAEAPDPSALLADPSALGLPPLEHPFDAFGPDGTCVGSTFSTVPCDEEHMGEVFAHLEVPGDEYPGAAALQSEAARCEDRFTELTGERSLAAGLVVVGSQPSEGAWDGGLHDIICLAVALGPGENTGSIVGG
ncbi:MAG: septum formation family protein [Acidimicrobiales bacterium]|nr:septum formation family protein [Acidimicrobiales bacterium]